MKYPLCNHNHIKQRGLIQSPQAIYDETDKKSFSHQFLPKAEEIR